MNPLSVESALEPGDDSFEAALMLLKRATRSYAVTVANDPCTYCGRRSEAIDHIEPARRGGPDAFDNLVAVCGRCNASKGADTLLGFLLWQQTRVRGVGRRLSGEPAPRSGMPRSFRHLGRWRRP